VYLPTARFKQALARFTVFNLWLTNMSVSFGTVGVGDMEVVTAGVGNDVCRPGIGSLCSRHGRLKLSIIKCFVLTSYRLVHTTLSLVAGARTALASEDYEPSVVLLH
jgi:hypothetical protein